MTNEEERMTREEAIEILENTSFFGVSQDDIDSAIDMAIEALKAEPYVETLTSGYIQEIHLQESCEDCVSRQEVINLINLRLAHLDGCKQPKGQGFIDGVRDGYCRIRSDVQSMCGNGKNVLTTDAVSRQAVIRIAEQGQVQGYERQLKELIKLPCVTPTPSVGRWIPVSERFPEDGQRVLVDYCEEDVGIMLIRFNVNGQRGFKAWMPLPEPYKAEA